MLHCWNPDHTQRPTFDELVEWIRNIIAKMEGAQHAVSLDVEYINTDVQSQGYLCPLDSQYPEGNVIQNVPEMSDDVHHPAGLNMKYINSNVHGHGYICPVDSRFPEGAAAAANCESYVPDYLSVASSYSTLVWELNVLRQGHWKLWLMIEAFRRHLEATDSCWCCCMAIWLD